MMKNISFDLRVKIKTLLTLSHSFVFTPENQEKAKIYIERYPKGRQQSAILPLLDLAQRQCGGWLPHPAIESVALMLGMPTIRALEVASFYTMFNLKPVGKYHVQVCGTTPCALRGAEEILSACERQLDICKGQVTSDAQFSLIEVECLGACVNAPVVQINDDFYEDLTPQTVTYLLENLASGAPTTPGSTIGRHGSEPTITPPITQLELFNSKPKNSNAS